MSNQLSALLEAWEQDRDAADWILGTVYKTEGSAYRKAGAMMLINSLGQQFGLLSGGCLEADIMLNARKVIQTGQASLLVYDGSDEDDWSFQLGIGCGGKVYIMLQPITPVNDLGLGDTLIALRERTAGVYYQKIGATAAYFERGVNKRRVHSVVERREDGEWLVTAINPEPHLLIVGGGADARPLVNIAGELGWHITVADPRPANARVEQFRKANTLLQGLENLSDYIRERRVDATVIMSHNIDIDALGLRSCQHTDLHYVALLGPRHRFRQVVERAGLDENKLTCPVSAPAGFNIGGHMPESIALSILAECHSVLNQRVHRPQKQLAAV